MGEHVSGAVDLPPGADVAWLVWFDYEEASAYGTFERAWADYRAGGLGLYLYVEGEPRRWVSRSERRASAVDRWGQEDVKVKCETCLRWFEDEIPAGHSCTAPKPRVRRPRQPRPRDPRAVMIEEAARAAEIRARHSIPPRRLTPEEGGPPHG